MSWEEYFYGHSDCELLELRLGLDCVIQDFEKLLEHQFVVANEDSEDLKNALKIVKKLFVNFSSLTDASSIVTMRVILNLSISLELEFACPEPSW